MQKRRVRTCACSFLGQSLDHRFLHASSVLPFIIFTMIFHLFPVNVWIGFCKTMTKKNYIMSMSCTKKRAMLGLVSRQLFIFFPAPRFTGAQGNGILLLLHSCFECFRIKPVFNCFRFSTNNNVGNACPITTCNCSLFMLYKARTKQQMYESHDQKTHRV